MKLKVWLIKMAQQEVDQMKQNKEWIIEFYVREIIFFEKKTTELLLQTIAHENKIEMIKRQKLRVSKEDMDQLLNLIKLTLKAVAIVNTYEYFLMLLITPSEENNKMFVRMRDKQFENLLAVFLLRVKNDQSIDFTISEL